MSLCMPAITHTKKTDKDEVRINNKNTTQENLQENLSSVLQISKINRKRGIIERAQNKKIKTVQPLRTKSLKFE